MALAMGVRSSGSSVSCLLDPGDDDAASRLRIVRAGTGPEQAVPNLCRPSARVGASFCAAGQKTNHAEA
jgi:hypothetical protein